MRIRKENSKKKEAKWLINNILTNSNNSIMKRKVTKLTPAQSRKYTILREYCATLDPNDISDFVYFGDNDYTVLSGFNKIYLNATGLYLSDRSTYRGVQVDRIDPKGLTSLFNVCLRNDSSFNYWYRQNHNSTVKAYDYSKDEN